MDRVTWLSIAIVLIGIGLITHVCQHIAGL